MQGKVAVVIAAAGRSRRTGGLDKLWTPLAGRLTLARTLDAFVAAAGIQLLALVVHPARESAARELLATEGWSRPVVVVGGGARRQDSVRLGLEALARLAPDIAWVLVHDGARPFVTPAIIEAVLQAAQQHGAATTAVPVKETLKLVVDGYVRETPPRSLLWTLQTPQAFAFSLLWEAHHAPGAAEAAEDDATLVERLGHPVVVVPGSPANLKITTREDLLLAESLLTQETLSP
jgi:2-C-methyl-D-erythritol 4-phosphate cytidylyltransferase